MILNAGNYQEQVPSWLHLVIGTEGGGEGVEPKKLFFPLSASLYNFNF